MGFPEKVRLEVMKRADFRCCRCHNPGVQVHHIIPGARGGSNSIENAAPLCPSCHSYYGGNPELRKQIRQMRNAWYEHCRSEAVLAAAKMDRLNKDILRMERRLGRKFTVGIESLQSEFEHLRTDIARLVQSPIVSQNPVLKARVQELESRATSVSGLVTSGGLAYPSLLRFRPPICPSCQGAELDMRMTFPGAENAPVFNYRCRKCGYEWSERP